MRFREYFKIMISPANSFAVCLRCGVFAGEPDLSTVHATVAVCKVTTDELLAELEL